MKNKDHLAGQFAYLPDGQKVRIEIVDGTWATVRRVGGARHRSVAVCKIAMLRKG
jgi:hypothetical protein